MGKISNNASELGSLQQKVEGSHLTSLDERENAARNRDQQLKGAYNLNSELPPFVHKYQTSTHLHMMVCGKLK